MINEALLVSEKPLRAKVLYVHGTIARLQLSDNQTIDINKKYLPCGAKATDELYLNLLSPEDLNKTKSQIAQQILQNILSSDA